MLTDTIFPMGFSAPQSTLPTGPFNSKQNWENRYDVIYSGPQGFTDMGKVVYGSLHLKADFNPEGVRMEIESVRQTGQNFAHERAFTKTGYTCQRDDLFSLKPESHWMVKTELKNIKKPEAAPYNQYQFKGSFNKNRIYKKGTQGKSYVYRATSPDVSVVPNWSLLDSISAYGSKYTKTPGIDRLVNNGISFMQSYSTDPVCCPARASWFTGSYSSENGVICNGAPCHPEMPDVSRQLQDAGYNTYYTGKWHVPGKNVRDLFHVLHEGSWWGEITDTEVTRTATSFLENYNSDEPFFLSVGLMNPHDICISPRYDDARATKVDGLKEPPYFKEGILEQSDVPPLPDAFNFDARESGIMQLTKRRKYKDWGDDMWRI